MERFEAYTRALAQVSSHDWVHWCRNAPCTNVPHVVLILIQNQFLFSIKVLCEFHSILNPLISIMLSGTTLQRKLEPLHVVVCPHTCHHRPTSSQFDYDYYSELISDMKWMEAKRTGGRGERRKQANPDMDGDVGFFPALADDEDEQEDSEASQKLKVQ